MKPTKIIHDLGQSLWLDNITRDLLNSGTLQRYIDEFSVTGLTSNPTIFDHAIRNSADYDDDIAQGAARAKSREDLFFDLALADLTRAADLFQPIFSRTDGVDGWVSLEVSPSLAYDTQRSLAAARNLHQRGGKPNLFIKDSRHNGGIARDRRGDFRRRSGQCHAAVFARAICRRGRGLPARSRTAHRGRAQSGRRFGRLAFCQPLGCRRERQRPGRTDQSAWHRDRSAHLQSLSRAARFAALPARRQCWRAGAAPALGQHRHQGPESV